MATSSDIVFEQHGGLGLVTLKRPKALNALTLPMCTALDEQIEAWGRDAAVRAIAIEGEGERAFCAGGDVRAIWEAGRRGDPLTADFFRAEYRLNRRIRTCGKPYVALIDGITMGGGVGVSVHGSHRIASERTMIAMPETGIGLFPDVGATYVLPRLPGRLGVYLGMTGARVTAADALYCGLATHYVPSARLGAVVEALGSASTPEAVLADFAATPETGPALAARRETIDRCFAAESVEGICAALETDGGAFAAETLETLKSRSPTSLKVTLEALRRGAGLSFDEAMVMEYRLSQACMAGHDFYEGIRALIIEKDNAPKWSPDTLEGVSPELVERHFAPLGDRDLTFT